MARVFGIQGNVTGKIANTVYAIVKGVNVARAYNPEPTNPQTAGQIESRAKLKVLSQMAKSLAPLIAFKQDGLKTPRNLFIKANYDKTNFENDVASIELDDVDLTGGVVGLGDFFGEISDDKLSLAVVNAAEGIKSVVFGIVGVTPQGVIRVFPLHIVQATPSQPQNFNLSNVDVGDFTTLNCFAYGIRFNDEDEFARYSKLLVSAQGSGSINVIRRLDPSSTTITETLHVTVQAS